MIALLMIYVIADGKGFDKRNPFVLEKYRNFHDHIAINQVFS